MDPLFDRVLTALGCLLFFLTRLLNSGSRNDVASFTLTPTIGSSCSSLMATSWGSGAGAVDAAADPAIPVSPSVTCATVMSSGSFLVRNDAFVIIDFHMARAEPLAALLTSCGEVPTPVIWGQINQNHTNLIEWINRMNGNELIKVMFVLFCFLNKYTRMDFTTNKVQNSWILI